MNTFHLSGYPRIGAKRELKFAVEAFWKGNTTEAELQQVAADIRRANWATQQAAGADKLFRYGHLTLDRSLSARLNAEDLAERQIQGRLAEAQNLLNIYKALGGGWDGQDAEMK